MRRQYDSDNSQEPPRKKASVAPNRLFSGEIMTDLLGKQWRLGRTVGVGGFGEIYLVSDVLTEEVKADAPYVAKIEPHESGPLFVEINCYLRIAKPETIKDWKKQYNLTNLGMPHYVASGSHMHKGARYRFLILPRYKSDLEKTFKAKRKFNLKTVLVISQQILDVLQYIHSKGYVHSDIKASNILMNNSRTSKTTLPRNTVRSCIRYNGFNPIRTCKVRKISRILRPNNNLRYLNSSFRESCEKIDTEVDQVYLLDYGLASKYVLSNGEHRQYCVDERKAHAGTLLFCSIDAHNGAQSRRSDLESLGYNIIYWLTSSLPWVQDDDNPESIHKKKELSAKDIDGFLKQCFPYYPDFLYKYFQYLKTLDFTTEPNYDYCRNLFKSALNYYGFEDNSRLDFDNCENGEQLEKWMENVKMKSKPIVKIRRFPLKSNLPIKPLLRKSMKKKTIKVTWSKILIDPEVLLKKRPKERKLTDAGDFAPCNGRLNINLNKMNPTYAMLEIFNKSKERLGSSSPIYRGDSSWVYKEGYTPAMLAVYNKMIERKESEYEEVVVKNNKIKKNGRKSRGRSNILRNKTFNSNISCVKTKAPKSATVLTREMSSRKQKLTALKRTYSLRG